jgi:hypothetical protein
MELVCGVAPIPMACHQKDSKGQGATLRPHRRLRVQQAGGRLAIEAHCDTEVTGDSILGRDAVGREC